MKISIKELTKLTPKEEIKMCDDQSFLIEIRNILGKNFCSYKFNKNFTKKVKIKSYDFVNEENVLDYRSVKIVFYQNKPVIFYQILGGWDDWEAMNVIILDTSFKDKVYKNCLNNYDSQKYFDKGTEDTIVKIDGYGMMPKIVDNKLTFSYK